MLPGDLERLGAMVSEHDARLLIIDPLSAALGGGKIDTHRDADVRRVLAGLQALAERDDVSVVGIGHWSKGESGEPLDRVLGSRAFTAAARSVLVLGKRHDDGDLVLAQAKSNLGVAAEALVLSLEAATARDDERCVETSRVVVVGTTDTTARALLRGPAGGERAVKRTAAVGWLAAFLAAGPKPASEVEDAAGAEGISQATLRRSREALGIKPEKVGHGWVWKLPGQDAQVPQDAQVEHLGSEHLDPEPPQAPDPEPEEVF